jgi:hypothetical protein
VASDAEASDFFGESVSISGNYAFVGGACLTMTAVALWALPEFLRSGTNWTEQSKLVASDAAVNDIMEVFRRFHGTEEWKDFLDSLS